jgi:hypothetical protein
VPNETPQVKSDPWVRWTYERLCVLQPHVETAGICRSVGNYYIVCPKLVDGLRASDGTALADWFHSSCRPAGVPIQLVSAPPGGAEKIIPRTLEEAVQLVGDPLTRGELLRELSLRLPRTFPLSGISDGSSPMTVQIRVTRDLTTAEEGGLDAVIRSLQQPWRHEIKVQSGSEEGTPTGAATTRPRPPAGLPALAPSRVLFRSASSQLRSLYEADEDFWSTNRVKVLSSWDVERTQLYPSKEWDRDTSRCLLFAHDSNALPLVNPLTIFRKVALVFAPMSSIGEMCSRLRCSESDLLQLMEMGHVQLVLPHSLELYPRRFLEAAAERAGGQMAFPRRIAALVVADARRRLPFLFAPFTTEERALIIQALRQASEVAEDPGRRTLARAADSIAEIWCKQYEMVNRHGSVGASIVGLGGLIGAIFRENCRSSRELEFLQAGLVIQWAGALNALAYPTATISNPFLEVLATLYGGAPVSSAPEFASSLKILVNGLLTLDSGVPPVELARSLGKGDVDRFRRLVDDVSRSNPDPEAVAAVIDRFNAAIRLYEGRSATFSSLDVLGLLRALGELTDQRWLDLAGWFAIRIIRQLQKRRGSSAVIGSVIDVLDGMVNVSHPSAILVARMRAGVAEARVAS